MLSLRSPAVVVRSALALSFVALCCLTTVSLVAAAPPPLSICGVCGPDSIDGASGPGTLDIHVDDAGDSRWVARVPVNHTAAETYRTNTTALETAVEDGWHRYDVAADDARDITPSIEPESRTVRVNYTVPAVASSAVGDGWVLDYFYAGDTSDRYDLVAERVSIHLPEGYAATNSPSSSAAEDGTLTWARDYVADEFATDEFGSRTYVTYGPTGVAGTLASWGGAAVTFGPLVTAHAVRAGVVPVVVLGFAIGTTRQFGIGRVGMFGARRSISAHGQTAIETGCAALGLSSGRRTLSLLAFGAGAVLTVGTWIAFGFANAVLVGSFVLAAASFLPLGHALERGDTAAVWGYSGLAVLGPLAVATAFAPYGSSLSLLYVVVLLFLPWSLGAGLVGYVLSLIGRRVAAE
ncbi:hypothetical protein [Natrialba asiatica]|uniref:Uncharacterized protein n=1 Tax=Natrialba asiatica (strain ATCC 700177 / DSM 12278 / JCM 9576 / FERM P-10747 / NBRC 102637 / 172P1) TaxID=29540 RepID=M0AMU4_NATA1|nr:hypothetical protein [Natrialba asiatica]ELZ00016.1 hypothetical protein C481_13509 [Natrialba asiatica DSM 12278]